MSSRPISAGQDRRVVLLFGGDSPEREISLASGAALEGALKESGYSVVPLDLLETPVSRFSWSAVDVAVIALHGAVGEDGRLQSELESLGVPYTGSGPRASQLAFHKRSAKRLFLKQGLSTPPDRLLPPRASEKMIRLLAAEIGFPLVVKPDAQGSSLGVSLVEDAESLLAAVEIARDYGGDVFLEQAIPGEEWTVGVLDDLALPPIRVRSAHAFFDFSAKYLDDETRYDVVVDASDERASAVTREALGACAALGCRGVSRVDLRVDPRGKPWLLEVNTIPGFTSHSLVPKAAAALGWTLSDLCSRMIASALQSHDRSSRAA